MRQLGLVVAAFAVPAILAAAPGTASVAPADQAAIKAYLTKVLTSYKAGKPGQANPLPIDWSTVLTPDLAALVDRNAKLNDGVGVGNDADPICGCQDWDTIAVKGIALSGRPDGRVLARVSIVNTRPYARQFVMARTKAGWRVWDVIETEGGYGSYRAAIVKENASLTKGK